MRFGKALRHLAIPQWKQCYLDYEHLKIFVNVIKIIVQAIIYIQKEKKADKIAGNQLSFSSNQEIVLEEQDPIKFLTLVGEQVNQLFFDAHYKGMIINRLFLHMKLIEMKQFFKKCQIIGRLNLHPQQVGLLIQMIQFIYVQTSLLQNAKQMNLQGERKIFKKHAKYAGKYFETPRSRSKKVGRISKELKTFINQMQDYYVKKSQGSSKKNRNHLRDLAKKLESSNTDSFIFGLWVGICFTILGVLIAILAYTGKSVETDRIFNRDFPTWRGIALFIIYMWIIGFNIYGFQHYSISHRIIFQFNEHHYSTSTDIFKVCGFFSTFFLVMFAIYTLSITQLVKLHHMQSHYLVLFVWGLFILYLINPLPIINFRSRLYMIKLIIKSIAAPLMGVVFPIIWITDQLISLLTPFKDFAYTICYYTSIIKTRTADKSHTQCNSSGRIQVIFVVGAIAYSFRILQCMKQGYDKGKYIFQPQFFNTIKYLFSFITLTLSFLWKAGNDRLFYGWIVVASLSTLISYIWDLKVDWALLEPNSPKKFLRKNLCYPTNVYYVVIVVNLLLRIVWAFTLSPSIANNAFGSPQIFSLITGILQIIRRGIWNMLRVQRQHISNCKNFKATFNSLQTTEMILFSKLKNRKIILNTSDQKQIQCQVQENIAQIATQIRIIKTHHLQFLKQILDKQFAQKQSRVQKTKEKKKQVKEFLKKYIKQFSLNDKEV